MYEHLEPSAENHGVSDLAKFPCVLLDYMGPVAKAALGYSVLSVKGFVSNLGFNNICSLLWDYFLSTFFFLRKSIFVQIEN